MSLFRSETFKLADSDATIPINDVTISDATIPSDDVASDAKIPIDDVAIDAKIPSDDVASGASILMDDDSNILTQEELTSLSRELPVR